MIVAEKFAARPLALGRLSIQFPIADNCSPTSEINARRLGVEPATSALPR